jgi:thiol:disulfide interchange protein DsbC
MKIYFSLLTLLGSLIAGDIDPAEFKSVPMFSQSHIKITKAYDHNKVYELQLEISTPRGAQTTTVFLTKDKKVVLVGDAMDASTGESIKRPVDMKAIRANADIVYGNGSKEYIVFTDPECPYCVKFEKMWPTMQKNVKLYVFFMPLSNHRNAVQMSYHVMKQKDQETKAKAILDMANGDRNMNYLVKKSKRTKLWLMISVYVAHLPSLM